MSSLSGTGVALITPFDDALQVDFSGLEKLLTYVTEGGVDYLVVLGTTGESPTVSWQEKIEILDFVLNHNKKNLPVVFGLGGNNTNDLLEKLDVLNVKKIDYILSASPYYNKPSQEGIYQHYKALADKSSHPVILYNVPGRTSSNIEAGTTIRLSSHPNIAAIKEASGDLVQCADIMQHKHEDFELISGDDLLTLPILSIGGYGVISVAANCIPGPFSELVRIHKSDDHVKATKLHLKMTKLLELLVEEGNPTSIKTAMKVLRICSNNMRLPLVVGSKELESSLEKELNKFK